MWLLFYSILAVYIIVKLKKNKKAFYNPTFWMFLGWTFLTGTYYTSGIHYNNPLKITGLAYFWAVFIAYALGSHLGHLLVLRKTTVYSDRDLFTNTETEPFDFDRLADKTDKLYFFVTLSGLIVFLIDFTLHNGLFSVASSLDLHVSSQTSMIGTIGKIITFLGLVIWLREVSYSIINNKKLRFISYWSMMAYMIPGILTAGRQSFLILVVSSVTVFIYSLCQNPQYAYKSSFKRIGFVLILFVLAFSVFIALNRQQGVTNRIALLEYMANSRFSSDTLSLLKMTGPFENFFLEILHYYSHELPFFQIVFDNWEGPLALGAAQFQLISQNVPESSFFSYKALWSSIERLSAMTGTYSHSWRTIAGSVVFDFGFIGGIIFIIFLGVISGNIHKKSLNQRDPYKISMLGLVCAGAFFSIQFSPIGEVAWYYPVIWLLIIPHIDKLLCRR